jgi:hypothetical protein
MSSYIYSSLLKEFVESSKINEHNHERQKKIQDLLFTLYEHNYFDEMDCGHLIQYNDNEENNVCSRQNEYKITYNDNYTHEERELNIDLQKIGVNDDPDQISYFFVVHDNEKYDIHLIMIGYYLESTENDDENKDDKKDVKNKDDKKDDKEENYEIEDKQSCYEVSKAIMNDSDFTIQVFQNIYSPGHTPIEHCLKYFVRNYDDIRLKKTFICINMVKFLMYHPDMKNYYDKYKELYLKDFKEHGIDELWIPLDVKHNHKCIDAFFYRVLGEITGESERYQFRSCYPQYPQKDPRNFEKRDELLAKRQLILKELKEIDKQIAECPVLDGPGEF